MPYLGRSDAFGERDPVIGRLAGRCRLCDVAHGTCSTTVTSRSGDVKAATDAINSRAVVFRAHIASLVDAGDSNAPQRCSCRSPTPGHDCELGRIPSSSN